MPNSSMIAWSSRHKKPKYGVGYPKHFADVHYMSLRAMKKPSRCFLMKNSLSHRPNPHLLRSQPTLCYFGVNWRCFSHALALFFRPGSAEKVFGVASWKFLFCSRPCALIFFFPSFYINKILIMIIILLLFY